MKILNILKGWATNSSSYSTIYKNTIKIYKEWRYPTEGHKIDFSKIGKQTMYIPCANSDDTITFDIWAQDNENSSINVFTYLLSEDEQQVFEDYRKFYEFIEANELSFPIRDSIVSNFANKHLIEDLISYKNKDMIEIYNYYNDSIEENDGVTSLNNVRRNAKILQKYADKKDTLLVNSNFIKVLNKISSEEAFKNRLISDISLNELHQYLDLDVNLEYIDSFDFRVHLSLEKINKLLSIIDNIEQSIIIQCQTINEEVMSTEKYYNKEEFAIKCENELIINPFDEYEKEEEYTIDNIHQRKMTDSNEFFIEDNILIVTSQALFDN